MKAIIALVVSFVSNIFAYAIGRNSATNKINAELQKRARKSEAIGYEAGRDGVIREQQKADEAIDTKKRDHFE